jgi:hypothetical protein
MTSLSCVPRVLHAAGLPARYVYWHGRSRRRYLFTATDWRSLADFSEGVAIAVVGGSVVWSGDIAGFAAIATEVQGAAVYVHLLAATPEERQAVIADVRPMESYLRLAA